MAVKKMREQKCKFRVLGLSATPGSSNEAIQVWTNYCINRFHFRIAFALTPVDIIAGHCSGSMQTIDKQGSMMLFLSCSIQAALHLIDEGGGTCLAGESLGDSDCCCSTLP